MDRAFVDAVQARVARIAISASAARGQQAPGLVKAARDFCVGIDLSQFSTTESALFASRLEATTQELLKVLPPAGQSWGVARKLLNIFLRDALYTCYLRDGYNLTASEEFFEIPLDSISSKQILRLPSITLPGWPGVKYLSADFSEKYQSVAQREADRRGMKRVHLDTIWWGARSEE
jgi:hypothetical protein